MYIKWPFKKKNSKYNKKNTILMSTTINSDVQSSIFNITIRFKYGIFLIKINTNQKKKN